MTDTRPLRERLEGPPPSSERPQEPPTVKRATLWDGVHDTHQTERELNGWREQQGKLL